MRGYNIITVKAPKHWAQDTMEYRTDDKIEFFDSEIVFASAGHKHAIPYKNVISIEPVE